MITKHLTLIGVLLSLILFVIAAFNYPGGTIDNPASVGYDWKNNYITHLLNPLAINGMENAARPWAVGGVFCLSAAIGVFFVRFSERIRVKSASYVIKYTGIAAALMAFLTVIPSQHDRMVILSTPLMLLVFFYITVFVLKSKLSGWKIVSVVFLLFFYVACYLFFSHTWMEHMPLIQKTYHAVQVGWVLGLEYFTREEDFDHIK